MSVVKWTEAMSVGVESLDEDHRRLIHMINDLRSSDANFAQVFNDLLDYMGGHFDREEEHLETIGYPGLDGHRAQHDVFSDRVAALLKRYRETGFSDDDQGVADFLWTWLKGHILIEDMKYAAWSRVKKG